MAAGITEGSYTARLLRSAGSFDSQCLQFLVEVAALEVQLLRRLRHLPAVSLEDAENERALVALQLRGKVEGHLPLTRPEARDADVASPGERSRPALRPFPWTASSAPSRSAIRRFPRSISRAPSRSALR